MIEVCSETIDIELGEYRAELTANGIKFLARLQAGEIRCALINPERGSDGLLKYPQEIGESVGPIKAFVKERISSLGADFARNHYVCQVIPERHESCDCLAAPVTAS